MGHISKLDADAKPRSWRDFYPIHPAAKLFQPLSDDELQALGKDIQRNGMLHPVIVYVDDKGNQSLLDGINRLNASERVGKRTINDDGKLLFHMVRDAASCPDPYAFVISTNIHRRHLTSEQRRDLIAKLLKLDASKSDRQVAKTVGVDHKTVAAVRSEGEGRGEIPHVDKRTDSKGRHQPASKTKTAAVKSAKTKSKPGQPEQQIDLEEAIAAADGEASAAARKAAYGTEEQRAPPPDAAAPDEDDSEAAAVEQHRQELLCQRAEFLPMLRILIDVAQYINPSDIVAAISDETEEITPFGLGDLAGWCTQMGAELVARKKNSKKHSKKHSKEAVATGSAEPLAGDDPGPVPEFLRRGGVS